MFKLKEKLLNFENNVSYRFLFSIISATLFVFTSKSSGKGLHSIYNWNDQNLYVVALKEVLNGSNTFSPRGYVGPAYVALARFFKQGLDISIGSSLILMNKIFFIIVFSLIIFLLVDRFRPIRYLLNKEPKSVLPLLYFISILLTTYVTVNFNGIQKYTDIPWTNFFTMALWIISLSIWLSSDSLSFFKYISLGFISILALQTRGVDGALLLLLNFFLIVLIFNKYSSRVVAYRFLSFIFGSFLSWIAIGITSRSFQLFSQYNEIEAIFPNYRKPDFTGSFTRLVQVFIDPCYLSFCDYNYFEPIKDSSVESWRLPMLWQIPSLSVFIVLIVGLLLTITWNLKKLNLSPREFKTLIVTILFFVFSIAKIYGYLLLIVFNGSIIRFGVSREFYTALFVFLIVYLELSFILYKRFKYIALFLNFTLIFISLLIYFISVRGPIPDLKSYHLSSVTSKMVGVCELTTTKSCKITLSGNFVNGSVNELRSDGHVKIWSEDGYWEWFPLNPGGFLTKETIESLIECQNCNLDYLPFVVGVNGTATYDDVINFFRLDSEYLQKFFVQPENLKIFKDEKSACTDNTLESPGNILKDGFGC